MRILAAAMLLTGLLAACGNAYGPPGGSGVAGAYTSGSTGTTAKGGTAGGGSGY